MTTERVNRADWFASLVTKLALLGWAWTWVWIPAGLDPEFGLPSFFCIGLSFVLFGLHRLRNPRWRDLPAWQARPIGRMLMGMNLGILPGRRAMEWYLGGLQLLGGLVFGVTSVVLMANSVTS